MCSIFLYNNLLNIIIFDVLCFKIYRQFMFDEKNIESKLYF